ncbi:MAG: hypothetical protein ACK4GE_04315 [Caldimicrobium sp.]
MPFTNLKEFRFPEDEELQANFLIQWQNYHSIDHQTFTHFLSELAKHFNLPPITTNAHLLQFNPIDVTDFNRFLWENDKEHKIMIDMFNTIGMKLDFPIVMKPRLNIVRMVTGFNKKEMDLFLLEEYKLHLLLGRAMDVLAESLK